MSSRSSMGVEQLCAEHSKFWSSFSPQLAFAAAEPSELDHLELELPRWQREAIESCARAFGLSVSALIATAVYEFSQYSNDWFMSSVIEAQSPEEWLDLDALVRQAAVRLYKARKSLTSLESSVPETEAFKAELDAILGKPDDETDSETPEAATMAGGVS